MTKMVVLTASLFSLALAYSVPGVRDKIMIDSV
jgi:hypothetical protein